jgi:peptidoglycan/LPS O-acetylase OafA/YrhL
MEPIVSAVRKQESIRFPILDALRFILAFWVVMSHFGIFPLFAGVDENTRLGRLLVHGWRSIPFGTPAVIEFFVISGFCIHLPFRNGDELPIGRYYARRYVRILLPLVGALVVIHLAGIPLHFFKPDSILWHSMLWSLLCEEIYYAVYPLLRLCRLRFGWTALLATAFAVGGGIAATHRYADDWPVYGPVGTALILLPVWLLGCLLAEQASDLIPNSSRSIWTWRFVVWLVSWVCEMLHFKGHISYTQTMLPFGVLAYFWIRREIAYGMCVKPWKPLIFAGKRSYSLYLIHGAAMYIFARRLPIPNLGYAVNWCAAYLFILIFSYAFFLLIEGPSHRLARKISLQTAPKFASASGEEVILERTGAS